MLWPVLGVSAAVVAAVVAADRGLAALAMRVLARRLAAASPPGAASKVTVARAPFVPQVVVGRYRDVEVRLDSFEAGGLDFADLRARLSGVRAPLRTLLSGDGLVVDQVTAAVTLPFRVLADRLPQGLTLRSHGDDLRVVGSILLMPVSGVLAVKAEPRQITLTPKVVGVPALVGFAVSLTDMPPELAVTSVRVTGAGLRVSVQGRDVRLHWARPRLVS